MACLTLNKLLKPDGCTLKMTVNGSMYYIYYLKSQSIKKNMNLCPITILIIAFCFHSLIGWACPMGLRPYLSR